MNKKNQPGKNPRTSKEVLDAVGATIDDERQFIQEEIIRRPKEAYFMAFLCGFLSGPGFEVYFP